jgi:hypothetical protein
MSTTSVTSKQKTLIAGSAAAISAIGLLTGPAIAQALPMIPLAPACSFNGNYVLNQSNGFRVEFPWNGTSPSGTAIAYGNDQKPALTGPVSGGIASDNTVNFVIDWGGPSQGQYTSGPIDSRGLVSGTTRDLGAPSSTANWESVTPLTCIAAPAPAAPAPAAPAPAAPAPAAPAAPTATVTSDVDHYSLPNGEGDVIGILRVGQVLKVAAPCPAEDWCNFTDGTSAYGSFFKNN